MVTMTIEERRALVQQLKAEGLSQRQIAERVGADHSTVHRDLRAVPPGAPAATGMAAVDADASADRPEDDQLAGGAPQPVRSKDDIGMAPAQPTPAQQQQSDMRRFLLAV